MCFHKLVQFWIIFVNRISHSISMRTIQEETSQGINHYTTTALNRRDDTEAFPSKRHLMYIVLGMGGMMAVAFLACLLHTIKICKCVNRSDSETFNDSNKDEEDESLHEENLPANYWTIVSNERGEMSTAIESDLEGRIDPQLVVQTMVHTQNESEHLLRRYSLRMRMNDELDEYLNPLRSCPQNSDEYIHPVHVDPVEFDEYIHPVHTKHVNTSFVSTQESTEF